MPSLAPSTSVLGIRKAKHLLNRSCFHYSKASLNHYASLTPTQAINELSQNTSNTWEHPYDLSPNYAWLYHTSNTNGTMFLKTIKSN